MSLSLLPSNFGGNTFLEKLGYPQQPPGLELVLTEPDPRAYAALLAKGMKPEMARLTLALKFYFRSGPPCYIKSAADETRTAMAELESLAIGNELAREAAEETETSGTERTADKQGRTQTCHNPVNALFAVRLNLVAASGLEPLTYGL